MRTFVAVGWTLLVLSALLGLLGAFAAALLCAIAAGLVAILAPNDARDDARRRNHARPARRW